ncbi:MAG: phosphate butyryltransferase [Bacteroidetes bacterium]|nr:MAG: phosphate butyryltransferase [Bacteroidota bacterium]
MYTKLSEILDVAKKKKTRKVAVAAAADMHVLKAIKEAMAQNIVIPVLVGNTDGIKKIAEEIGFNLDGVEIIEEPNPNKAAVVAVEQIRKGNADVLMKGLVSSGPFLKAVLDKEKGLRKSATLSHVAFFESPFYHKLMCVSDAALNVEPEFKEKVAILNNGVDALHRLGIKEPKVAIIGAVETVNPKMTPSTDAALMTMMNKRNQITGCIVDGPLALDNAVSLEAAQHKGIDSPVAGEVDLILTPDIYSANIMYKTLNFLGGATSAAVIMGATVPVILTSRSDTEHTKHMSIALAAAMD